MEETLDDIKLKLAKRLAGKRVALAGIGNVEKGDDGFGVRLIQHLRSKLKNTALFECGTTPENYSGPIVKYRPQALLMIDAANLGAEPGHVHIVEEKDILSIGLSTHDVSSRLLITYLKDSLKGLDLFLLGVQPKHTALGEVMSRELEEVLLGFEKMFSEILS